ncbi:MAG: hypothetical protein KDB14_26010 [Planctomycetales bacterium]|nr:hypothetical protein [Planctomycetales bacterium]
MGKSPANAGACQRVTARVEANDWRGAIRELQLAPPIEKTTSAWRDLFLHACSRGQAKFVQLLIEQGINVNVRKGGQNALCNAMDMPSLPVLELLLDAGIRRDLRDGYRRGPAFHVCGDTDLSEKAAISLLERLAEAGVPLDGIDSAGLTPLDHAVTMVEYTPRLTRRITRLLELGARVRKAKLGGGYALQIAVDLKQAELVQQLLAHGAALPLAPNGKDSLEEHARAKGLARIAKVLQTADVSGINRPLPRRRKQHPAALTPFAGVYRPVFTYRGDASTDSPRSCLQHWLIHPNIHPVRRYRKEDWDADVAQLAALRMEIHGDELSMSTDDYRMTFVMKSAQPRAGGGATFELDMNEGWTEPFELVVERANIRIRAVDREFPHDRFFFVSWKRFNN